MKTIRAMKSVGVAALVAGVLLVSGCKDEKPLPEQARFGPDPTLPAPVHNAVPTVNTARAVGWPQGGKPVPAQGLNVAAFARDLDHPRWLYVLPNSDVLVAETNGPERKQDTAGIKGWFVKLFQKQAGAGVKSPNRITLLRDSDGDGVADVRSVFIDNLNSPFGMALVGSDLYVADTDALLRFAYQPGDTKITASPVKVADLPAGEINHHWTKNVIAGKDGKDLFVTVGSNSNVGENGLAAEKDRAAILKVDPETGKWSVYAAGLRNPNGMDFEPETGVLWTVVNERDELGNDLVPDYLTSVQEGGFYGWPFSYWGQHVDTRVKEQHPDLVAKALKPDYSLGAHTASLGLVFARGSLLPASFARGAFIGQHGSWNREPRSGYKVIFVPFSGGKPSGLPQDVLTGFLNADGEAQGRPVGVAIDNAGALMVADDVGNAVWRVTPAVNANASLPQPARSVP